MYFQNELEYEVHVAGSPDETTPHIIAAGLHFHPLKLSPKGTNPLRELSTLLELFCLYREIVPAAIFQYTIKPNIYGSLVARILNLPCISITTGLGYTFTHKTILTRIAQFLYRLAFSWPTEIWFLNEDDRRQFVNSGLVDEKKCVRIPGEGIDTEHYKANPKPKISESYNFLLIARVLFDKGVGEYFEAAREIKKDHPQLNFQLIGKVGAENPAAIPSETFYEWLKTPGIDYLGETTEIRPYIESADCVVLPSYREGLSRSLLEAAAMSKPLVVSDVPGCRELVDEGQNGFIVPARSVAPLKEALLKISQLPPESHRALGEHSRQLVLERYSVARILEIYREATLRLIQKGPRNA